MTSNQRESIYIEIAELTKHIESNIPNNFTLVCGGKGDYFIIDDKDYVVNQMPLNIEFSLDRINELSESIN
jgi:hypothetical protein